LGGVGSQTPNHFPISQKPVVIPNEAQRNEESRRGRTIFEKTMCHSE
jgi:hypothetical protein